MRCRWCGWWMVALLVLVGCGGSDPVAKGPSAAAPIAKSSTVVAKSPQAIPASPANSEPSPAELPASEPPASEPSVDPSVEAAAEPSASESADSKALPVPQAYRGVDQPDETPVPPEVQEQIRQSEAEFLDAKLKLAVTYPQASVRASAVGELGRAWNNGDGEADKDAPKKLATLRAALRDPSDVVRSKAAAVLESYEAEAVVAMPELLLLLQNPEEDSDVVDNAFDTLKVIGPGAKMAIPSLRKIIKANEGHVWRAVRVAGAIGPEAKVLIPELLFVLRETFHADDAAEALGKLGCEAELLAELRAAKPTDSRYRSATRGLGHLPEITPAAIDALVNATTKITDVWTLQEIATSLGKAPGSERLVKELGLLAKSDKPMLAAAALTALGEMNPKFDSAIPILTAAASSDETVISDAATRALGKYKSSPETRLALLLDRMLKSGGVTHYNVTEALQAGLKELAPVALAMALDGELEPERRVMAIMAIYEMLRYDQNDDFSNDFNPSAATRLRSLLGQDEVPEVVQAAAAMISNHLAQDLDDQTKKYCRSGLAQETIPALRAFCAERAYSYELDDAIALLIAALDDPHPAVVRAASDSLGNFEEKATDAVPRLVKLLTSKEAADVRKTVETLQSIGTQPEVSVPALKLLVTHESYAVRKAAFEAVSTLLKESDLAVDDWLETMKQHYAKSKTNDEREESLIGINALGKKAAPLVPLLIKCLDSESSYIRSLALDAAGEIGPEAKAAIPAILKQLDSEESAYGAIQAIGEIGAGGEEFAKRSGPFLDNLDTRWTTLLTLTKLGPSAKEVAPKVVECLTAQDDSARQQALEALQAMGDDVVKAALEPIRKLAQSDSDSSVQRLAVDLVVKVVPDDPLAFELHAAKLGDMDDNERQKFFAELGDEGAKDFLRKAIASGNVRTRRDAYTAIPSAPFTSAEMVALYTTGLDDADDDVRESVVWQLQRVGTLPAATLEKVFPQLESDQFDSVLQLLNSQGRAGRLAMVSALLDPELSDLAKRRIISGARDASLFPHAAIAMLHEALPKAEANNRDWIVLSIACFDHKLADVEGVRALLTSDAEEKRLVAHEALFRHYAGETLPDDLARSGLEILKKLPENEFYSFSSAMGQCKVSENLIADILALLDDAEKKSIAQSLIRMSKLKSPEISAALLAMWKAGNANDEYWLRDALQQQDATGRDALLAIALSDDEADDLRVRALDALCRWPMPSTTSYEQLLPLLQSKSSGIRSTAAVTAAAWGAPWDKVEPQFIEYLSTPPANYVSDATFPLLKLNHASLRAAAPQLLKAYPRFADGKESIFLSMMTEIDSSSTEFVELVLTELFNPESQYYAAQAINRIGTPARSGLLTKLETIEESQIDQALYAVQAVRWPKDERPSVIAWLKKQVESKEANVRFRALETIVMLDRKDPDIVALLVSQIAALESDEENRHLIDSAFYPLQRMGAAAAPAVATIVKQLDVPGNEYSELVLLRSIGPAALPALPKLLTMIDHPEHANIVIDTLGQIGPAAASARPAIEAKLQEPRLIRSALRALGKINTDPKLTEAAVLPLLRNPNLRYAVVEGIGSMRGAGQHFVPILIKGLSSSDVDLKLASAHSLAELGKHATSAVDPLLAALATDDPELKRAIISALGSIASDSEKVMPVLVAQLKGADKTSRWQICNAICGHKQVAAGAIDALVQLCEQDESFVSSLGRFIDDQKSAAAPLVPYLTKQFAALCSQPPYQASYELRLLSQLGADAKAATPTLVELYATSTPSVREQIARALWKIDPQLAKASNIPELPADPAEEFEDESILDETDTEEEFRE